MLDELVLDRIHFDDINKAFDSFQDCNCINGGRSVIEFSSESAGKTILEEVEIIS